MRITRIFVEKLFGVFDHEIRLNMDDRITIIHAPNGYGKTIILKMLDGIFNDRYVELYNTPYKSFQIEFDGGQKIEIQQGFIEKISQNEEWLNIIKEFNVYLIESQRLLSVVDDEKNGKNSERAALLPTVTSYAAELVEVIKGLLAEYASVSQSLDRSFLSRALQRSSSEELSNDDFRDRLVELEESRNRLMESGLLEKEEEKSLPIQPQEIDQSSRNFLMVYLEDVEKKLAVFDSIASKIGLFRKIINSKFSYKEIVIDREKGFIFQSKYPEGIKNSIPEIPEFLSPSLLSSGEQHELVLLYELLFKVKKNSLVLIDEPELSLHVGWQVNFLRDLQEITTLADLDILIATHAPSLIHDRWDLTVELKGVAA